MIKIIKENTKKFLNVIAISIIQESRSKKGCILVIDYDEIECILKRCVLGTSRSNVDNS